MKRRVYQTIIVLSCLLLTVGPATSAGPPNPTPSDAGGNTAGGTDALINTVPSNLFNGINNTAFGYKALTSNTNGSYNTASGVYALSANTTGYSNTATGQGALLSNTEGSYNTATGLYALLSNTTGTNNTATGLSALTFNTTGYFNTATGVDALSSNTTGYFNTATGVDALFSNTTGIYNVASGAAALRANTTGNSNTASGVSALRANTTGGGNSASGVSALSVNTSGSYNTASGYQTLLGLTSGHGNTALGWGAGKVLTNGSNNIYLGHPGVASESATLRLGNGQTRAFIKGVVGVPISGLPVTINAAGQLGVAPSSERYKQAIAPLARQESAKVHQLKPVIFHYKTEPTGSLQYGLIAEEVAQVYPEIVTRDEQGGIDGVRYEALTPILVKVVQEQHQQITTQAQQMQAVLQQVAEQAQQMTAQAQQLAELKLQNESLRAAVDRLQGPAAVAMTTASRLQ